MADVNYKDVLDKSYDDFTRLIKQREELELEIAKLHQFIKATANMLSDEDRVVFMANVDQLAGDAVGLTEAVRNTLKAAAPKWLTAASVRDQLLATGFDFSGYTSNPLASIHAVLKRMKPSEAETNNIEGVAAYRWISRFPRLHAGEVRRRKVAAGRLGRPKK
jgi:hypothetical protein